MKQNFEIPFPKDIDIEFPDYEIKESELIVLIEKMIEVLNDKKFQNKEGVIMASNKNL